MTLREARRPGERIERSHRRYAHRDRSRCHVPGPGCRDRGFGRSFRGLRGSIEDYLAKDGATVLRGVDVPELPSVGKRPILLATGSSEAAGELRALARWRFEATPFVVAVDAGADIALKAHLLDVVVGDADLMSEKVIRRARSFIVRVGGDGLAPGAERLANRMGIVYERIAMAGTSLDAANVAAAHSRRDCGRYRRGVLRRGGAR